MRERKPKFEINKVVTFKNKNYVWNGPKYVSGVIKSIAISKKMKVIKGKSRITTSIAYLVDYNGYKFSIIERDICADIKKFMEKERKAKKSSAEKNLKVATNALEKNKKQLANLEAELKKLKVKS